MRDLFVFAVVMLSLPLSFRRPFLGLIVFSWLAYMRPQDLCWGFARSMRLSFFVGFAMLAGWWAVERGRVPFARWDVRMRLLLGLAVAVTVSYAFAQRHDGHTNRYFFEFLKIVVVAMFTTGQVYDRERLRWLLWTIALCLAFYGVKGGLFGFLSGGATILRGPGGMLEDNNDFALALVMNVPLLWYLGLSESHRPLLRKATLAGILLTVVAVLLTHSRGAFLALVAASLWIAWRSQKLFRATAALAVCALAFFVFAPPSVLERVESIGDTGESSIRARFTAWGTAMRMIEDNPVLGVGLRNFTVRYREYAAVSESETTYVAHNSYLQIWAECGTIAFGLYLLLLGSVFVTCRKVYRIGRSRPDLAWAADYARMMEATTVAFCVGATFLNRGHFDLVYHWIALVTALNVTALAAFRAGAPSTSLARERTGRVAVRRRPAFGVLAPEPAPAPASAAAPRPAPRWDRRT